MIEIRQVCRTSSHAFASRSQMEITFSDVLLLSSSPTTTLRSLQDYDMHPVLLLKHLSFNSAFTTMSFIVALPKDANSLVLPTLKT